jgi:hypothetical protein
MIDLDKIEITYDSMTRVHFRVPRGGPGTAVTVRLGVDDRYVCLTCRASACDHCFAARQFYAYWLATQAQRGGLTP